jgi:hypothetical protein
VSDFPLLADDFYALRDDRTNRCTVARDYQRVGCVLAISPQAASTATGQTMLLVAANLLSRWCRRITIALPRVTAHSFLGIGSQDLGEFVLAQMHDADPFGMFQITRDDDAAADIVLSIGRHPINTSARAVFIDASGWLASLSLRQPIELPPVAGEANRLGSIAAACLGVAQLFKIAVGMRTEQLLREGVFDLFRLAWSDHMNQAPWPADLNVGNVLMVGAGSVGSAAAYCARIGGLCGAIDIVDKDTVKIENFNRCPIFGRATFGFTKADAVAAFLSSSDMTARAIPLWWNEFIQQRERLSFDFDVWLPLANEFDVRLAMQHSVPPLMIHASTTSNWGTNHGRHLPGRDDCLADRFPAEVSADALTCATGQVEIAETSVDAALPFASMFAGLLIASDLVRAQLTDYPQVPNFALFDWFGQLDVIQMWDRAPRPGCVCGDQGKAFQEKLNPTSKYRRFFHLA